MNELLEWRHCRCSPNPLTPLSIGGHRRRKNMFFAFYVTAFYSKHSTGLSSLCSSGHRVTRLWVNLIRSAVVVQNPQNRRDLFLDFMNRPPSASSAASHVWTTNGDNTNNASWGKSGTFQIFVFANGSLEKLSSLSTLWIFASVLCFFCCFWISPIHVFVLAFKLVTEQRR